MGSEMCIRDSSTIARVFFIAASMFLTMSIWGYTTKKSLAKMGSFLMMGLIGLIIASIVNIFLGSSALQFAMSIIGVIIFAGLTAYDTQVIKEIYVENENSEDTTKKFKGPSGTISKPPEKKKNGDKKYNTAEIMPTFVE